MTATTDHNTPIVKSRLVGAALLLIYLVLLCAVCTQYVAAELGYHPALGQPLFGVFYSPFSFWRWTFGFYEQAPTIFNFGVIGFLVGVAVGLLTFVLVIGFKSRSSRKHADVHGTARFAAIDDVKNAGLMEGGRGVYCGGFEEEETGRVHYLRHDGPEHVCALAPTRSGKGVSLVVPTLLSWPHSIFVLDRKGENYAMTAGWRQRHANNVVLRFDPAEPDSGCAWNPLQEVRHRSRFQVSDTQNIALMVVDDNGKGISGDHFRTAAFELIVGLILHALYKGDELGRVPCLQDCAHMLTNVGDFAAIEDDEHADDEGETDPKALAGLFAEMRDVTLKGGQAEQEARLLISGVGRRMLGTPARELGSIISTANNALSLYRDPIVGENTNHSDFSISDLMDHERPVSLYFITSPRNTDRLKPLARLLLTLIITTLADQMEFDAGRSKTAHLHRLLLLLDEFPSLGKLEKFEEALAMIAGYGIKAYLITQDVMQLYKAYTNYESIISNCHVRVAFAPNKVETAEWMSKMTGATTVVKESISNSGKRFGMVLDSVSRSYQEVQRPLMTPDEILNLKGPLKNADGDILEAGEMLIFVAGQPVIHGRQILYFQDPTFSDRSQIPPPAETDRITPRKERPISRREFKI